VRGAALILAALAGCGGDGPEPAFPADYAGDFTEVRDCRSSADHDLHRIRVLADATAMAPYLAREAPIPDGAVLLKEEYDFGDDDCSGPILEWSVMAKRDGAWSFQDVDADRRVVSEDDSRCVGCHELCGDPPDGFDGTCAVP
jgi:hypothetical protein